MHSNKINRSNFSFIKDLETVLDLHATYSLCWHDPWYENIDSKKQMSEFCAEIEEMKTEIALEKSKEDMESEIGDAFWDFIGVIRKLEDEWKISASEVFRKIYTKMSTRKSYLLSGEQVTKEEAIEIWNHTKKAEWYDANRLWTPDREKLGNT